jgi:hypothetical protein
MWFHKKNLDNFLIQMNVNVLKQSFCWKITFIWKIIKIILENFVSKSILYVCQNARWNLYHHVPQKNPTKVGTYFTQTYKYHINYDVWHKIKQKKKIDICWSCWKSSFQLAKNYLLSQSLAYCRKYTTKDARCIVGFL